MPRLALVLGLVSLACSLSVVAFFVGVPLGLLAVLLALSAIAATRGLPRQRRTAVRALVLGGVGLGAGLLVWFVHVRAIQTAYHIPERKQVIADFEQGVASATAPLADAPPRAPVAAKP